MADLVEFELGVHLNQRHEDYLQDHGLGYSSIVDLYLSAVEWWEKSPHNKLRELLTGEAALNLTKAFQRGAALHAHTLDGPKAYARWYGVPPTLETHPDAVDRVRDMMEICRRHGLDTRGLKDDLADRIERAKIDVVLLRTLQRQFVKSGKKAISERDDARIRLLHRMMMRTSSELKLPEGSITIRHALTNALTEVSIFWVDDNGIRQRARFDILKPNLTGDLKSITQWRKSNFNAALLNEIILRGYMVQAAHYHEARRQLRKAVAEGRVFGGNKTQRKLLERIARSDYWGWVFIFAKMDGAAQVKSIVVRPDFPELEIEGDRRFTRAVQQREEALSNFLFHREFHGGLDTPWFDPEVVWEPKDEEWPMFAELGQ